MHILKGLKKCYAGYLQTETDERLVKKKRKAGEHARRQWRIKSISQSKYAIEVGAGYGVMNPEHEAGGRIN